MEIQEKEEKDRVNGQIDITEMLSDYFRIFSRMWVWVLILALLAGGLLYIRERRQYVPVYTASATFTVNIKSDQETLGDNGTTAYFDNAAAEQMATTFPYILTSGVLRRKVANDLGRAVTGNIQASAEENTNLLTISVTDRNAQQAYDTLQSVIKNYPSLSEVIVGRTQMEILDETGVPQTPVNPPDYRRGAVKGAVLGAAAGLLWILLIALTRKTVRKESDVHRYLNMSCLGSIPEITFKRRSDARESRLVLTDKKVEEVLQEPLRMIRNKIEYQAKEYSMKTFLVTSAVAGEGKSTVAVNLALSLARAGKKVALVDCDLRNPSDWEILGVQKRDEKEKGLCDLLKDGSEVKLAECIWDAQTLGMDGEMHFHLIPGGEAVEDGAQMLGSGKMKQIITELEKENEYVILDSAPAGLLTDSVVLAQYAQGVVVVVRKDFARVGHIMDCLEQVAESRVQIVGGIVNGI